MTNAPTPDVVAPSEQGSERQSRGDIAVGFAGEMARATFKRGELAELRRMDPNQPDAAVFWRLMASRDLLGNEVLESKWALILNGIALMTPSAGDDADSDVIRSSAHNPTVPVGLALFQGGDANRERAFYSETRLNRLLTARGPMLRTLLARTFRMLGNAEQSFNWRQMTQLILSDGHDEDNAERVRRRIARAYYQAERRSSRSSESDSE